ncbi:pyridoxamine 5'-phosphate oxidase [Nemorincola caseinilytica]|uniref:Pyridoxine/pyridoxamine 5'-phosphate oxidase n=2 Tax=Nemorincola caseinilytica TaxID=2054315 RepID=A0ABP8NJC2_9BACT
MDYSREALDEQATGDDPMHFFMKWFSEAESAQITEVNAMTLATVDADHRPHARIVLLKGADERGFSFFTNYDSAKGTHIAADPFVALLFFWKELERQVRIDGRIEKLPAAESDEYFYSRPVGSRLGAWASPQSREIPGREVLEQNYERYQKEFGENVPRPPHWGGYLVVPQRIEFWQGRSSRMHDRISFSRNEDGSWKRCRLAP